MNIFKITKGFQGGPSTYCAVMPKGKRMRKGCWEYQLQEWGEGTSGGHNYGWRINATSTRSIPKVVRHKMGKDAGKRSASRLKFNPHYLEPRR